MARTRQTPQGVDAESSQLPSSNSETLQASDPQDFDPSPDLTVSVTDNFTALSEEELDRRIAARQQEVRLERKRTYLQALERGENPIYDPAWDAPQRTSRQAEVTRQPSSDNWMKLQITPLKYKGANWSELHTFISELHARFATLPELGTNLQRITYAGSALEGAIRRRWVNHIAKEWQNRYEDVFWKEMEDFLKENISDGPTRTLEAVTRLHHLEQRPDQRFNAFLEVYENIESELPDDLLESYRVCSILDKLQPELRQQIVA